MTLDEMKQKLKKSLTPKRYNHSIGVMETSVIMARYFGADEEKAMIAGLLHDCAKDFSKEEMFALCDKYQVELDDVSKHETSLIHGFLGAYVAREEYGVTDSEIFEAIYYHTVSKYDMSLLTKIIYIADLVEPSRNFDTVNKLREILKEDIDKALIFQIDNTLKSVIDRGGLIHSNTITTRNYYLEKYR